MTQLAIERSGNDIVRALNVTLAPYSFVPTQLLLTNVKADGELSLTSLNVVSMQSNLEAANDPDLVSSAPAIKAPVNDGDIIRGMHKLARELHLSPRLKARIANWISEDDIRLRHSRLRVGVSISHIKIARKIIEDAKLTPDQRKMLSMRHAVLRRSIATSDRRNYTTLKFMYPSPYQALKLDLSKVDAKKLVETESEETTFTPIPTPKQSSLAYRRRSIQYQQYPSPSRASRRRTTHQYALATPDNAA